MTTPVCIASTMRSGSTLLKALLAVPDDVSDLPEFNFQGLRGEAGLRRVREQSDKPIVVMKRPAWFHEVDAYPRLPDLPGCRAILLVRDVYDTVLSLRKMVFRKTEPWTGELGSGWLAHRYWAGVMRNLLALRGRDDCLFLRYEDLVANPVKETAALFRFIGSAQCEGVSSYNPPGHAWRWGRDDGGAVIQSLTVRPPKPQAYARRSLLRILCANPKTLALREELGYPPLPAAD